MFAVWSDSRVLPLWGLALLLASVVSVRASSSSVTENKLRILHRQKQDKHMAAMMQQSTRSIREETAAWTLGFVFICKIQIWHDDHKHTTFLRARSRTFVWSQTTLQPHWDVQKQISLHWRCDCNSWCLLQCGDYVTRKSLLRQWNVKANKMLSRLCSETQPESDFQSLCSHWAVCSSCPQGFLWMFTQISLWYWRKLQTWWF